MAATRWLLLLAAMAVTVNAAANYRLPGDVVPKHYDLKILTHLDQASNFTFIGTVRIQLYGSPWSAPKRENVVANYRLPGDVVPKHYDLKILTHLDHASNFTFIGTVRIQLDVLKETKAITLHQQQLMIHENSVKVLNDKRSIPVTNITYDEPVNFMTVLLGEVLKPGQSYDLSISFTGFLKENLVGFYRSSYKDSATGEDTWLATTQFESTDARRAFPCFDEPAMKATFIVTLGRKEGLTAISNMPIEDSKPIDGMKGWHWDRFQKSVPMSTYLLAFVISDFHYVESPLYKNKVVFKIWARKEAINQTQYASEVGPKVLAYFEDYYDVPYPLPKQDMVAIPDFSAGAMENWGIITYRETALLYSKDTSSTTSKARVSSVIAHELAHQWFGNLVTMEWWTDLWLNEGFATYMATLGLDHVHPDWNVLLEESADNMVDVFRLDSLDSSHPVSVPIGDPAEIAQIFDAISYKKGSAIIRMMNLFLGEQVFREGVNNYLKKYKYKNAAQDHLWNSLTDAAHKAGTFPKEYSVKTIMDSWTKQAGYPLITVNRNYDDNTVDITQNQYQEKNVTARSAAPLWWVPLSLWGAGSPKPKNQMPSAWLAAEQTTTLKDAPNKDKWLLLNIDMAGVYRVNYDPQNWKLLQSALEAPEHSGISALNRFQLITDSMALAASNQLSYSQAFRFLDYLKTEEEYLPWKAALSSLSKFNGNLLRSADYEVFTAYMNKLLTPVFKKIGGLHNNVIATPGKLDAVKHQVLISSWACKMNVENCEQNALDYFQQWFVKEEPDFDNPIPNDFRNIVYCKGVSRGGKDEWNFIWQRYIRANVASEKTTLLSALGCTKEVWLLAKFLEESINKDGEIRKQDSHSAFYTVGYGSVGYFVARDFLFSRINDIVEYHKDHLDILGRYVNTIASQITTRHGQEQLVRWTKDNKDILQKSSLAVKQTLESLSLNLDWKERNEPTVIEVLKKLSA